MPGPIHWVAKRPFIVYAACGTGREEDVGCIAAAQQLTRRILINGSIISCFNHEAIQFAISSTHSKNPMYERLCLGSVFEIRLPRDSFASSSLRNSCPTKSCQSAHMQAFTRPSAPENTQRPLATLNGDNSSAQESTKPHQANPPSH